jgi:Cu/Ag efflux protein CusF
MPRPVIRSARHALAALAAVSLLAGCGKEEEQPAEQPAGGTSAPTRGQGGAPADRQPDQVYTVRGEIRQLPDSANPATGLQIHHESIPDFVNKAGEVVGMKAMIMQFTPGPGVDLTGLTVGDKVRFTFDVDWDGSPLMPVTEIEPLPSETELDFAPPSPPSGG